MGYLLAAVAAVALLPTAARAEAIPEPALRTSLDRCVKSCDAIHSYAFCAATCGCMVREMSRHWDMEDVRIRAARLKADPREPATSAELERLAGYCSRRQPE